MEIRDVPQRWEVAAQHHRFQGRVVGVRSDEVRMTGEDGARVTVVRDVVTHPGSVAVLALDADDRVLLLRQYRHPVGYLLWEIPAGLRDVAGEPLPELAARELAEEAGYRAGDWLTLLDIFTSPGMTSERVRIFLARDLSEIPAAERTFQRVHEEADMPLQWVPLRQAVAAVLGGDVRNPLAVTGILATYAARESGFATLRAAGTPET